MNSLILIPSRLGSTRLPNKPLADINGKPMIVWVMEQALKSGISDVYVAAAEEEIAAAIKNHGGKVVLTNPDHASGTDRIYEALQKIEALPENKNKKFDYIINVQGDLPTIEPSLILASLDALKQTKADISTLAVRITDEHEKTNPNVVKAVVAWQDNTKTENFKNLGNALYFTRASAPTGDAGLFHHIGLYAYTRHAIESFVKFAPSNLERSEKLEQLRALENGLKIAVAEVETIPLGVDTQEDLEKARKLLS